MAIPVTRGVHHLGFTVSKLEESASFFTSILGWKEVRRDDEYPAIFVSNGSVMVTLWKNKIEPSTPFNREQNIGLHHVAFVVDSECDLEKIHEQLAQNKVPIEFSPEVLRQGPAKYMICYEPSGIRIEFIWSGDS